LLPDYTADLHESRLLYDHSTCLSNFNSILVVIALAYLHYHGHDSAFLFLFFLCVLCDIVFITLLMCVCRIIIKGYLLTYLRTQTLIHYFDIASFAGGFHIPMS